MGEEELNEVKKCLRSVLISCPEGTPLTKVESDYKSFMGIPLNYPQFGYKTIDSFLRSIPDTARVQGNIVYGVSCAEIKHVTKLINNQRKVPSNLKRVQKARQRARYQPPPSPFSSTQRNTSAPPSKFAWGSIRPSAPPPPPSHPHMPPPMHYGHPPDFMRHLPPGPQRAPPPPHHFYHQMPPPPPYPPQQDDMGDELVFSEEEIIELLMKEKISESQEIVHILSLAFPYIYRGSNVTILDLNLQLCNDIATAVALDCEEELEGAPAVLVCKMHDAQNLSILESSPKVQCIKNIETFNKIRLKVVTLKFSELIHILNTSNEHFYKQTTFIIFVDVGPSRMKLLSDMVPNQLQYLFLSTCCDSLKNASSLYDQPQIVIAKDGARYRDYANNGEKMIDNLARKLAVLNIRHPSQHAGPAAVPNKVVPSQPHGFLPLPHGIPPPPHGLPPPPHGILPLPHGIPSQPHGIQPHNIPSGQPHGIQPHNIPSQPHGIQPMPMSTRPQLHNIPSQPPIMPTQTDNNIYTNGATPSDSTDPKAPFPALRHLTESAFKLSVNLLIQAEPNKGKSTLLLESAISKVDTSLDKLQIILTTPSPKSSNALFLRLKECVSSKGNTEVRAFGYSEGGLDKLNAYINDHKVHILVMDNGHVISLVSKAPAILSHCKMIGCDELYGSHYTKQVPSSIKSLFEKTNDSTMQFVVMTHLTEDEKLVHGLFPKPYWHIRQEESGKNRDVYTVSFFHQ